MLVTYEPFQGVKMFKFQDFRDKYNEIVKLQAEERECLQSVAELIVRDFSDSLELEQSYWVYPGDNRKEDYVFIAGMKDGEKVRVVLHELIPDADGKLSFFIGLTVDKSPVSFPKTHLFVRITLSRDGSGYTVGVGDNEYETSLSEQPIGKELMTVSAVAKQFMLRCLDSYAPAKH